MKKLQRHISLIFTVLLLQSCDSGPVESPIPEPRKIVWEDLNRSASSITISNQQNIFISTSQTLERSSDKGDTWEVVHLGAYGLYNSSTARIYAVNRHRVLVSPDQGINWFNITPDHDRMSSYRLYMTFIVGSGQNLYYKWGIHAFRSINEGLTWEGFTSSFPSSSAGFATDAGTLFARGTDQGRANNNIFARSTDRGLTWAEMPIKMRGGYAYQNGMICIGGDNQQLWISEDDGITWYPQLLPEKSDHGLVLTMTPQNEIIIGGSYAEVIKFYRSVDGGATWTEENTGLNLLASPYSHITTLVAAEDGTLYATLRGFEGTTTFHTLIRSR